MDGSPRLRTKVDDPTAPVNKTREHGASRQPCGLKKQTLLSACLVKKVFIQTFYRDLTRRSHPHAMFNHEFSQPGAVYEDYALWQVAHIFPGSRTVAFGECGDAGAAEGS